MLKFNRYHILIIFIIGILIFKKFNIKEFFSQKSKCYSCEKESKNPHPSNCYSCENKKNNILLNRYPQRWG